jgi:hypothetical protein
VLRRGLDAPPASFEVPGGTAVAIGALALCGWLLSTVKRGDALTTAIVAGIGTLIFVAGRRGETARSRPRRA